MKNISLTVKIWLTISLISLMIYLIVLLIMPLLIRKFFTDSLMQPPTPHALMREPLPPAVIVRGMNIRGFIILQDGTTIPPQARESFSNSLFDKIKDNAFSQQSSRELHESTDGDTHIRYFVHKAGAYGQPLYQVTFLKGSDEAVFVNTLLFRVMTYASIVLIISWFASILFVRYLTRPLVRMEQHVKRIANRDWHDPVTINRGDEIGQLASSIESMRRQLVKQEEAQQSMLQNISHELKTPVMVIRSYAQAINDGVYPKGDLAGSIKVIDEEGERLERLIKQLLYLNRLDYLSTRNRAHDRVRLDALIQDIAQRLNPQRPDITWHVDVQPVVIAGDEETLRVMVENLLDNHLRHAASILEISLRVESNESKCVLSFWNDGSGVDLPLLNEAPQPYYKGPGGKFGLGLTIVQRIVRLYRGEFSLTNERNGVASTVRIPLG